MLSRIKGLATVTAFALTTTTVMADGHSEMTADTVVATVGEANITLGQLIARRAQLPPEFQSLPDEEIFAGLLDQMINQQILANTVDEASLQVEIDLENQRRAMLAQQVVDDFENLEISEEELQAAFDEAVSGIVPETEYNAAHILVNSEEEATDIKTMLDDGADFSETAMEKSTGPSGPNGGNLGWFGAGMMVPAFEEAVMALEVGEVSDPVETQFGWHIVILNEVRETALPTLDDARAQLTESLRAAAFQERLNELVDAADIVRPAEGDFDPAILSNIELIAD